MRYAFLALMAAHGMAHLPGFLVPWRWLSSPDLPFKTTLLWGQLEVGEAGIRAIGVIWLLTGAAIVASAVGLAREAPWAAGIALPVVLISGLLCFVELPHARLGLALNVVVLLFLTVHPTVGVGGMRWRHATEAARGRLVASVPDQASLPASVSLPDSVEQYFAHVMPVGVPDRRVVSLTQSGEFRMSDAADSWRPFIATQDFTLDHPGFIWDARIKTVPLLPVYVRDSYINGIGGMSAAMLGLIPVMNAKPSSDLNAGALQRYLAEAIWFPEALRPEAGVHWEAIGESSARATLTDRGTTVSLIFEFNANNEVDRIWTPARQREVNGAYVATPWDVTCGDWQVQNGVRIPT